MCLNKDITYEKYKEHKMKQIIVINNKLKMSKGKVARCCHTAGFMVHKISNFWSRLKWFSNNMTTVVVKTNDWDEITNYLDMMKIKNFTHVDAGKTQVSVGSECMVTFFTEGNDEYINDLKLY